MSTATMEVSSNGAWVRVPVLKVGGESIVCTGRWLKLARIHAEDWLQTELAAPGRCIERLKQESPAGFRADIFTFAQKVPCVTPRYPYHREWDSVAAARTTKFQSWWNDLPQETRKNVRRSQKRGVRVDTKPFDDELVRGILAVNNDDPERQGQPNVHYGKTFDQVKRDHCSFLDRSDFICAWFENGLIGFLKLVYRGEIASILNLSVQARHSDKRPANALVAKAVELCEAKGISRLTYGMLNYGNKRHGTLRQFKIRNGFEEVLTPRYYIPLTRWGALALTLRLHRGLVGILPDGAIQMGLGARTRVYRFRRSMSRCSSTVEQPKSNRLMERSIPPAGSS